LAIYYTLIKIIALEIFLGAEVTSELLKVIRNGTVHTVARALNFLLSFQCNFGLILYCLGR